MVPVRGDDFVPWQFSPPVVPAVAVKEALEFRLDEMRVHTGCAPHLTLDQRLYTLAELTRTLLGAGFLIRGVHAVAAHRLPSGTAWGIIVVSRK